MLFDNLSSSLKSASRWSSAASNGHISLRCLTVFNIFSRHAWQPTLEYFLPVQMCHMRVNEKYGVWHGLDHLDDAIMAPVNFNHIDGYISGTSTLARFKPGERVPGLNVGGWHDAGDYDLRVESQIGTVWLLAMMVEEFGMNYEATLVAYGVNRADWSYIPGGVISGTALIRLDLPELKVWPFFWQQTAAFIRRSA